MTDKSISKTTIFCSCVSSQNHILWVIKPYCNFLRLSILGLLLKPYNYILKAKLVTRKKLRSLWMKFTSKNNVSLSIFWHAFAMQFFFNFFHHSLYIVNIYISPVLIFFSLTHINLFLLYVFWYLVHFCSIYVLHVAFCFCFQLHPMILRG